MLKTFRDERKGSHFFIPGPSDNLLTFLYLNLESILKSVSAVNLPVPRILGFQHFLTLHTFMSHILLSFCPKMKKATLHLLFQC